MKQDQFGQHGQDGRDDGSDGSLPGGGSRAMARASEAVLAIPIGGGIGWAVDRWLGTDPWLVMIGLGLGFAAFVRNLLRLRKMVEAEALAAPQQDEDPAAWLEPNNDDDHPGWMILGDRDDDDSTD